MTDACGGLVAAISGRNVKRLLREPDLSALDQPIEQFLTEIGTLPAACVPLLAAAYMPPLLLFHPTACCLHATTAVSISL